MTPRQGPNCHSGALIDPFKPYTEYLKKEQVHKRAEKAIFDSMVKG